MSWLYRNQKKPPSLISREPDFDTLFYRNQVRQDPRKQVALTILTKLSKALPYGNYHERKRIHQILRQLQDLGLVKFRREKVHVRWGHDRIEVTELGYQAISEGSLHPGERPLSRTERRERDSHRSRR